MARAMATTIEQILGVAGQESTDTRGTAAQEPSGDLGVRDLGAAGREEAPQAQTADPSANDRTLVERTRANNAAATGTSSEAGREKAPAAGSAPAVGVRNDDTGNGGTSHQAQGKPMTYKEMFEKYFPGEQPLSAKEQKRHRREAVYSALGDGISALSNLYYTSKYAPSTYDPSTSLSKKSNERWQRLVADRKALAQQYYNAQLKAMQADDLQSIRQQNADANEAYKRSQAAKNAAIASAQQEVAAARAKKDTAAASLALQKLEYLKQGRPIELATKQAELDLKKAKADNAKREADDRHAVAQSTVRRNNASAEKSRSGGSGSGGKSGGGIPWYDSEGNLHHAKTEAEAKQQSKLNGTYVDDYATNTSRMVGEDGKTVGLGTSRKSRSGWHSRKPATPAKPRQQAKPQPRQQAKPQQRKKTGVEWK